MVFQKFNESSSSALKLSLLYPSTSFSSLDKAGLLLLCFCYSSINEATLDSNLGHLLGGVISWFHLGLHLGHKYNCHPKNLLQIQVTYITLVNMVLQSLFVYLSKFLSMIDFKKFLLQIVDQIWQLMYLWHIQIFASIFVAFSQQ